MKSQRAISALRLLRLHSDGRTRPSPAAFYARYSWRSVNDGYPPIAPDRVRREHQLSGFFRRLGGFRQRPLVARGDGAHIPKSDETPTNLNGPSGRPSGRAEVGRGQHEAHRSNPPFSRRAPGDPPAGRLASPWRPSPERANIAIAVFHGSALGICASNGYRLCRTHEAGFSG